MHGIGHISTECVNFVLCTAMLEARGIPPHLLGSLGAMGSRIQHMLQSKVMSSTNSEFSLCTHVLPDK